MSEMNPITREELLLNSISEGTPSEIEPITRQELYLSAIAGESDLPADMTPITREEIYYQKILDNGGSGGGGEATGTKNISITQNGTTTSNVKAYATAEIAVNVPNSYGASDEGKVVSNGALASQTSRNVTQNGTYDTTVNDEVVVNVPNPSTGTKNITANGDHDVTNYATAHVAVPQPSGSTNITSNGTHDVTNYASAVVNVPTGITPTGSQTFTQNGTYDVTSLAEAVVNVEASGGVHTEEGYVELTDVNVTSEGAGSVGLTIPVDLRSADGFILNAYVVETGEVADGVVTKYDKIEVPTAFDGASQNFVFNYMMEYPLNPVPEVYRDATNLASVRQVYNVAYTYTRREWNGAQLGVVGSPVISANGVTVNTMNGTRYFCKTGAYVKFKYEIKWW